LAQIADILDKIKSYAPDAELELVMQAYLLAAHAHAGQTRKTGEAYLTHPLAVADILADMRMDTETISTALLHDAMEDSPLTKEELTKQVGPVVAELVDGVTKIGKLRFRSKEELQAENFRKMMLGMSRDLRVVIVKLADRTHNMRTIGSHRPEKQRTIAQETIDVYAPLAARLGLTKMKTELEDICFSVLEPEAWKEIRAYLQDTAGIREAFIDVVLKDLHKALDEAGVKADVSGRLKHGWSIYRKLQTQGIDVSEIHDLIAFRVIADTVGDCYHVLGLMHAAYPPVPGRIKDYIARPKPNGYQSLHTTVIGPESKRMEIQIRTKSMHDFCENGVAAHWVYKQGRLALKPEEMAKVARIREMFAHAEDAESAEDFMEAMKVALYEEEVFVFTPNGDIKSFPLGATALDFAFAVHTEVGNRCVGAKANGRMVNLGYELQTGDRMEILTSPTQNPSRDWLDIARTGRAISKIRRYLRSEEKERAERIGKDMLDAELRRFDWTLSKTGSGGRLNDYLKKRSFKDSDMLLFDVGMGMTSPSEVAREILPEGVFVSRQEEARQSRLMSLLNRFGRRSESPVLITGEDGIMVSYAKCCSPLPGEAVVGFITRGRGITVHKEGCEQLASLEQARIVPVEWQETKSARHSSIVQVFCEDRTGMLASITKVCEVAKVNIQSVKTRNFGGGRAVVDLQISVRDVDELRRVARNLEKIPGVDYVKRAAT